MAEPREPYALARLILEYLRAFAWPVIVLLILVVYRQDLVGLVSEREFEAFGVRFGPRIEEVQENVEAELADIRVLLDQQSAAPPEEREQINRDLAAKVDKLQENVTREVGEIRQLEQPPTTPAGPRGEPRSPSAEPPRRSELQTLEHRGFEALIAGDKKQALQAFDQAYALWPDYHNVSEIRALLRRAGDPPDWPAIYRQILTDYSWGMSQEHRAALRKKLY